MMTIGLKITYAFRNRHKPQGTSIGNDRDVDNVCFRESNEDARLIFVPFLRSSTDSAVRIPILLFELMYKIYV